MLKKGTPTALDGEPVITATLGRPPIVSPRFPHGGVQIATASGVFPAAASNVNLTKPAAALLHMPVPGRAEGSELNSETIALTLAGLVTTSDKCCGEPCRAHKSATRLTPFGIRSLAGSGISQPASLSTRSTLPPPLSLTTSTASCRQIPAPMGGRAMRPLACRTTAGPWGLLLIAVSDSNPGEVPAVRWVSMNETTRSGVS